MSTPSVQRIVIAGLAGGILLNAVDTPWSVMVMVPRLEAFTRAHDLTAHPLVGPWFLLAHLWMTLVLAWVYALARTRHGAGLRTAFAVTAAILVLNRAFGLATVLMGLMPLDVFLGFSLSFVVGVLAAGLLIGQVIDRAGPVAQAA